MPFSKEPALKPGRIDTSTSLYIFAAKCFCGFNLYVKQHRETGSSSDCRGRLFGNR